MKNKISILVFIQLFLMLGAFAFAETKKDSPYPILRIGYFHGGRTMLLYRALISDYFEAEKLNALFYTKKLRTDKWEEFDRQSGKAAISILLSGKVKGTELNDFMFSGKADMAFIGEAAFIRSCALGEPVMAIAQLGADDPKMGGHVIVIKKGIKIKGPKDLEKLVWGTRRSSGGDDVFLKEFLLKEGVDLSKVKFIFGIDDDLILKYMREGKIQGGYYHLMDARNEEKLGFLYSYRKLDWINPQTSQSLAVVTKDYFNKNKETLKKFLRGYMKRVAYEHALPKKERMKNELDKQSNSYKKSLNEMEMNWKGMNLPQYPKIPSVVKSIEYEAMDMLYRHKFIDKKIVVENCYDNSLVIEVAKEMYPDEKVPL